MLLSTGEQISISLMAMAIAKLGCKCISLLGQQVGILTDSFHTHARIERIDGERMREELNQGKIVIVAGFQGVNEKGDITTLGRGGSDTTAVALAAVLNADLCEIYTDVDGIFTADPRIVPGARKLKDISYDEMLELASLGARVLHNRSVVFGEKLQCEYGGPFQFEQWQRDPGQGGSGSGKNVDQGVTYDKDIARVSVMAVRDIPGVASKYSSCWQMQT